MTVYRITPRAIAEAPKRSASCESTKSNSKVATLVEVGSRSALSTTKSYRSRRRSPRNGMARDDPAPRRVRPLPLITLRHAEAVARTSCDTVHRLRRFPSHPFFSCGQEWPKLGVCWVPYNWRLPPTHPDNLSY
jgi:hypothetical protein